MQFDIRSFFKNGKTPFTAQFLADLSGEDFDGSVVSEPVRCSFEAHSTLDGVIFPLTIWSGSGSWMTRILSFPSMKKVAWIYGSLPIRN